MYSIVVIFSFNSFVLVFSFFFLFLFRFPRSSYVHFHSWPFHVLFRGLIKIGKSSKEQKSTERTQSTVKSMGSTERFGCYIISPRLQSAWLFGPSPILTTAFNIDWAHVIRACLTKSCTAFGLIILDHLPVRCTRNQYFGV